MKYTPIEMPRGTHYGNNYYEVYSSKVKRIVKLFSNLEYYNFLSLEMNPDVRSFCEQPLRVPITMEGETRNVIFDMYVEYVDGSSEFQEVKYESELNGEDEKSKRSREQIRREKIWCVENGHEFSVRTEKEIISGRSTTANLNVMAARVRRYTPLDDYYDRRIEKALADDKYLQFGEMKERELLPEGKELEHLCYLYAKGIVTFDIDNRPISDQTKIRLKK